MEYTYTSAQLSAIIFFILVSVTAISIASYIGINRVIENRRERKVKKELKVLLDRKRMERDPIYQTALQEVEDLLEEWRIEDGYYDDPRVVQPDTFTGNRNGEDDDAA